MKIDKDTNSTNPPINEGTAEQASCPWFLYVIQTKYNHYYTGISKDWTRRVEEHSSSGPRCAKALKGKGPLTLKYCCELPNQRTAMQAEIWLKKQTKKTKVAIVKGDKALPFSHSPIMR